MEPMPMRARALTDFSTTGCTNGHCARRADDLTAASRLLLSDLSEIVAAWGPTGAARADLDDLSDTEGIAGKLTGLGPVSCVELAGERMQLGLIPRDLEQEHR